MDSGRALRAWRVRHSGYRIGQWADCGDFAAVVGRCPLRQCWNHDSSRLLVDSEISIIEEYCVLEPPAYLLLYADVNQILSFFDAAQISVAGNLGTSYLFISAFYCRRLIDGMGKDLPILPTFLYVFCAPFDSAQDRRGLLAMT
jgi:hypothetical protein